MKKVLGLLAVLLVLFATAVYVAFKDLDEDYKYLD
mgnify:CR=1 FL=1|jgi:hypothetical protein|tara:strand:+ start:211 stop:315 length:105 start_codon:yes stop_codon:yes gene_type:complete